jgi:septum formation protein
MISEKQLILASASPRRRELLDGLGLRFDVLAVDVPELDADSAPHLSPVDLARENARRKAVAAAERSPGRWVLGADTVVTLDGRLFGKPASLQQAREFLRALSGRTHEVITGCALLDAAGREEIFHEVTRVTFRALPDETIERYLAEVHVLDKAGAYALQERGEWLVERIEGSRTNVIGLPVETLEPILKRRGLLKRLSGNSA